MNSIDNGMFVVKKLKRNKYEAYFVGGCVRDYLLNQQVNDIDITTNATPNQVMALFKNAKPTGLKYGTVTVLHDLHNIEVTTYRVDGTYLDYRRPEEVFLTDLVTEDVKRRDFTINGLLMDENYKIYDYIDGQKDLENKTIRAIGNPNERFNEDALRLLRATYFQAKLGFSIEAETKAAMKANASKIDHLPNERILNEVLKMLAEKHQIEGLKTIEETTLSRHLPGLEKGIKYINQNFKERVFIDTFFALCFSLNGFVDERWKFSNIHKNKYQKVVELVIAEKDIDKFVLYEYGLEISTLANKILFLLGKKPNQKTRIKNM
ncbi:MAG: CCA tRNA nucleotidyltransferase [Acholeplasmataceae bacterium]|nr:CCA tRNA nucleotidyltransferase [Acholeplasmataceae bacterium]